MYIHTIVRQHGQRYCGCGEERDTERTQFTQWPIFRTILPSLFCQNLWQGLLHSIAQEAVPLIPEFKPAELSKIAWACATCGVREGRVLSICPLESDGDASECLKSNAAPWWFLEP